MSKVSIIIPVYNVSAYLNKCLESVVGQTLEDITIIVVNDGSTDNSKDIIGRYAIQDKRFVVIDKYNEGVVIAREMGVESANSEYLFFLDGDDYLAKDAIEVLYNKAQETNAEIVVGDFYSEDFTSNVLTPRLNQGFTITDNIGYLKLLLNNHCNTSCWGKLFHHSLFSQYTIESPEHFIYGEDTILLIQLSYYAKTVAKVDRFILYYVQNSSSITGKKISDQALANLTELPFWVEKFLVKNNLQQLLHYELDIFFVNTFMWSLGAKGYKNAHERSKFILKKVTNNARLIKEIPIGIYTTIYAFSKNQFLGLSFKMAIPRVRAILETLPTWIVKPELLQQFINRF